MKKINNYIKKQLEKKVIRFLIVGVANTIVGYGVFALGIYLNLYYYLAYILSYIIGVANSYVLNKKFTFKSTSKSLKEPIRFVIVYLISFAVGSIFLYLSIDILNVNEYVAGFINLIFITSISWIGHNKFSFRNKN